MKLKKNIEKERKEGRNEAQRKERKVRNKIKENI